MASVNTAQLSADCDHAITDFSQTITIVSPAAQAATTFTATKNFLTLGFLVEVNGREVEVDTRWYININGLSTYPDKGWTFSNDGTNYKVASIKKDSAGVLLALDCIGANQAG